MGVFAYIFLTVTISVGFERKKYSTTEGEGVVSVCVVIMSPKAGVPRPFNLSYSQYGSAGIYLVQNSDM